ncbi:hypothetical protein XELAEV_18044674mg [Xenopus laevis]|uniref:Uncharacterized protein n=1 Tax=Xenopus laevis TaxID=8355 RepID=A0A974BZI6_XENLA|nr:hypothetical protein XELAEV_18044674mg [Xenopus laevis]
MVSYQQPESACMLWSVEENQSTQRTSMLPKKHPGTYFGDPRQPISTGSTAEHCYLSTFHSWLCSIPSCKMILCLPGVFGERSSHERGSAREAVLGDCN